MSGESLRDIALELLESAESLAEDLIYENSGDIDGSLAALKRNMAEYRIRIDSAK
ncbi:MAG: hypothetical protein ACJ8MO_31340 [Bacillus sp. (in: firmicutes)]